MTPLLILAVNDEKVTPGVLGFLVVAALGVATYLLIRSMNRQMRNIQVPPDDQRPEDGPGASGD